MKKILISSCIIITFFVACTTAVAKPKYQCPMKCEAEKTYDSAGKCPQCGMDMKEVK